jgi:TolB-like protein
VALKFLPAERVSDEERKRRFVREARAASALNHPNIVTVYEIDAWEGADFIAMEYVAGRTLGQVIGEKPLTAKEALGYAVPIADALAAAHKAGIVHRDLKPGNLMVTEDGRVKVLDFGLAKLTEVAPAGVESTLTLVAGTPAYMAPEQAEGRAVDARTDIYAFGAVLYEMVAGRRAFAGLAREDPLPLKAAPAELQQIVTRCLRRDPAERFQSAAELKAALEEAAKEPPAAPSIAVLPFVNMSADKENEYFSDGLAEEIINALTKVPGLRVMARTSSFYFRGKDLELREIAARLNAGHILEGSVRKAGDRIRVTAQLIKLPESYHLWSERYDRRMADVFEVQDEIAQAIVERLRVQLAGKELPVKRHTASPEAFSLYLKGRHWWSQFTAENWRRAVECYESAIREDPGYALPHAGAAVAYFPGLLPPA